MDAPIVNAASFCDGKLVVFTDLIRKCRNDHELACLIGHEMAHVVLEHSVGLMMNSDMTCMEKYSTAIKII